MLMVVGVFTSLEFLSGGHYRSPSRLDFWFSNDRSSVFLSSKWPLTYNSCTLFSSSKVKHSFYYVYTGHTDLFSSLSLCVTTTKAEQCTITQVSTYWRIMGNPRGQPEHAEIPVAVSEDNQPAKPPHTATVSNMTEMERSQPRDSLLQLLKVLRKKNNVLVYKRQILS